MPNFCKLCNTIWLTDTIEMRSNFQSLFDELVIKVTTIQRVNIIHFFVQKRLIDYPNNIIWQKIDAKVQDFGFVPKLGFWSTLYIANQRHIFAKKRITQNTFLSYHEGSKLFTKIWFSKSIFGVKNYLIFPRFIYF